jgi:hypothetical protein
MHWLVMSSRPKTAIWEVRCIGNASRPSFVAPEEVKQAYAFAGFSYGIGVARGMFKQSYRPDMRVGELEDLCKAVIKDVASVCYFFCAGMSIRGCLASWLSFPAHGWRQ